MSDELEVIGAASIGAVARDTTGDGYLNGPCPNCDTEIDGLYCSNCGQSAKDLKRPFLSLFRDILGDTFSFDGRLWRTVPALMLKPGKVTRSYIDGQRMRYVPPFRLFLITSVLFFLVLFGITENQSWIEGDDVPVAATGLSASNIIIEDRPLEDYEGVDAIFSEDGGFDRAAAESFIDKLVADDVIDEDDLDRKGLLDSIEALSGESLSRAEIFATVQKWVPRLSFLLLPSYVINLVLMHFWIRRIYVFDHVIVALHMQSFFYLFATAGMLLTMVHPGVIWGTFAVSTYVYPFLLMKRAYSTNWFFNLFRVIGLHISTLLTVLGLMLLVIFVGANDLGLLDWSDLGDALNNAQSDMEEGWNNVE